ncbi:hypothetical protein [Butyrivibrio fibrisolvens]|uniref:Uncharacterized protein n=1 Tax=Butyrivibrio fibrisolvens TaxID=831 RepID=A0A317G4C4_BUTFI|nr:hypothetical protein [Butyrivibrio fibrisolvens]PWT28914.1 hypothetical protein CPT75_18235 [Butyrivibrio fibrisolvens]
MAQHYSFRVPWHDNGWNGSVCTEPSENYSCMRLKGINQSRDEELENEHSGCAIRAKTYDDIRHEVSKCIEVYKKSRD